MAACHSDNVTIPTKFLWLPDNLGLFSPSLQLLGKDQISFEQLEDGKSGGCQGSKVLKPMEGRSNFLMIAFKIIDLKSPENCFVGLSSVAGAVEDLNGDLHLKDGSFMIRLDSKIFINGPDATGYGSATPKLYDVICILHDTENGTIAWTVNGDYKGIAYTSEKLKTNTFAFTISNSKVGNRLEILNPPKDFNKQAMPSESFQQQMKGIPEAFNYLGLTRDGFKEAFKYSFLSTNLEYQLREEERLFLNYLHADRQDLSDMCEMLVRSKVDPQQRDKCNPAADEGDDQIDECELWQILIDHQLSSQLPRSFQMGNWPLQKILDLKKSKLAKEIFTLCYIIQEHSLNECMQAILKKQVFLKMKQYPMPDGSMSELSQSEIMRKKIISLRKKFEALTIEEFNDLFRLQAGGEDKGDGGVRTSKG